MHSLFLPSVQYPFTILNGIDHRNQSMASSVWYSYSIRLHHESWFLTPNHPNGKRYSVKPLLATSFELVRRTKSNFNILLNQNREPTPSCYGSPWFIVHENEPSVPFILIEDIQFIALCRVSTFMENCSTFQDWKLIIRMLLSYYDQICSERPDPSFST